MCLIKFERNKQVSLSEISRHLHNNNFSHNFLSSHKQVSNSQKNNNPWERSVQNQSEGPQPFPESETEKYTAQILLESPSNNKQICPESLFIIVCDYVYTTRV